jgi:Phytanoyl-CoA dioxygenase (PhyH)
MDKWFRDIAAQFALPAPMARQLRDVGYVVLESAVPSSQCKPLAEAYDAAVLAAHPDDVSVKDSTRVHDFVNRGPAFDDMYLYGPLLAACCCLLARPFKLSSLLARTLEPGAPVQELHQDFKPYDEGLPMVGFIVMVDEFRHDNGATRFMPGSHLTRGFADEAMNQATIAQDEVLACGQAGDMIIYNGSVWHSHTANRSTKPRRSLQGAYIRREDQAAINQAARLRPETLARISPLAKYLLDVVEKET